MEYSVPRIMFYLSENSVKRTAYLAVLLFCTSCAPNALRPQDGSKASGTTLNVTEAANGCVSVERKAQGAGLHIPNQIVCPTAK
jgi:hypothetical protein